MINGRLEGGALRCCGLIHRLVCAAPCEVEGWVGSNLPQMGLVFVRKTAYFFGQ